MSEVTQVNSGLGALIKSLPLISILAMIWLYVDNAVQPSPAAPSQDATRPASAANVDVTSPHPRHLGAG